MKIGLIVAMDKEFELICKTLKNMLTQKIEHLTFAEGRLGQNQIILVQSGIGKVCSAVATMEMIKNFAPEYIISTGVAGGFAKKIKIADIVAAKQISYHDVWCGNGNELGQIQGFPAKFDGDKTLLKKLSNIKLGNKIHCGLIVSGDRFIDCKDELKKIKKCFPTALAVDMESASIAQVCHLYNIPFMALRIISDAPDSDNQAYQYKKFGQTAPAESLEIIKKLLS